MEIIILIIVVFVIIGAVASIFDNDKSSVIKANVRTMSDKEEKEFIEEHGGKPGIVSDLFANPSPSSNSQNSCSHSWQYKGENQKQVADGDRWPNKFYSCSKCGKHGVNRGNGIEG